MPDASVIIITRNRKDVAGRAVRSALAQEGDVEVIVIDDASDDGTDAYIRAEFPRARVHRSPERKGYIVHRNQGARLATAPVIVSIDDDAEFGAADTVLRAVTAMSHERVGAVSFPHVDIQDGVETMPFSSAPDATGFWVVPAFVGTAYALRRDVFLRLGGFEELLFHWNEEEEFCRRLLSAGMVCRAILIPPVRHHPHKVGRHSWIKYTYIARNRILVPWLTAPMPELVGRLAYNSLGSIAQQARSPRGILAALEGLGRGFGTILTKGPRRSGVGRKAYRLYEYLRKNGVVRFDEIAAMLPALADAASQTGVRTVGR